MQQSASSSTLKTPPQKRKKMPASWSRGLHIPFFSTSSHVLLHIFFTSPCIRLHVFPASCPPPHLFRLASVSCFALHTSPAPPRLLHYLASPLTPPCLHFILRMLPQPFLIPPLLLLPPPNAPFSILSALGYRER